MSEKEIIETATQILEQGNYILIDGRYFKKIPARTWAPCFKCRFLTDHVHRLCHICIQLDYGHLRETQRYKVEEVSPEELNENNRKIIWKVQEK